MQGWPGNAGRRAAPPAPAAGMSGGCRQCWQVLAWGRQQWRSSLRALEYARACRRAQAEAEQRWREERGQRRALERQLARLEGSIADLRRTNAALLQKPFGFSSEKRRPQAAATPCAEGIAAAESGANGEDSGNKRKRGGQPGARCHKRVQRSGLPVRTELLEPPADLCVCAQCGKAYSRNGETLSERVEISVQAHVRRIRRPRFRAACQCARQQGLAVPEVQAELEPALFRGSNYGRSVYVEFLLQVYWQRRPARAFEREWLDRGVYLPASTLLGHIADWLRWFSPLEEAIGVRQQEAGLAHGDETTWPVHVRAEQGGKARCWLWVCVTSDAVRMIIDARRSSEAGRRIFGELGQQTRVALVCDRYCVYKRLARESEGRMLVAFCWAHVRRDYLNLGKQWSRYQQWSEDMVARIGKLYRLNRQRLALWDSQRQLAEQGAGFAREQQRLEAEFAELFEHAERERQRLTPPGQSGTERWLSSPDPRLKPLRSLLQHREGLGVFLRRPEVPLDNNAAERALRRPVVGRKLSYGSHSREGAQLQAMLLSVFGTLSMGGIDLKGWLEGFLDGCAQLGPGQQPDPAGWLPWDMPPERRQALQARPTGNRGPAP